MNQSAIRIIEILKTSPMRKPDGFVDEIHLMVEFAEKRIKIDNKDPREIDHRVIQHHVMSVLGHLIKQARVERARNRQNKRVYRIPNLLDTLAQVSNGPG